MYRRVALLAAASLFAALVPSATHAQTAPAAQAPAAAKPWVPPQKGEVTVDFMRSKPMRVKGEIQTKMKIKNTSKGSIALLTVEEFWYNTKREIASSGIYRHKQLLNPGEIIEFTISSPEKPDLYSNNFMFKHVNGTVRPSEVKKM